MTHPETAKALLPVMQADREAAAAFYGRHLALPGEVLVSAHMRAGKIDESPLIEAFARHRLAHSGNTPVAAQPSGDGGALVEQLRKLHEAARGCEFDLVPTDGPIAQLALFMHENGDRVLAALSQPPASVMPDGVREDIVRRIWTDVCGIFDSHQRARIEFDCRQAIARGLDEYRVALSAQPLPPKDVAGVVERSEQGADEIARQALSAVFGSEVARTNVAKPVNGSAPYSFVLFEGQRIEFHDGEWANSFERDAGTAQAAAYAQRINDRLLALAKAAAELAFTTTPAMQHKRNATDRASVGNDASTPAMDREAIARIIDETAWKVRDDWARFPTENEPAPHRIARSLAKADAILALSPPSSAGEVR